MTVYLAFNETEGLDDPSVAEAASETAIAGVARAGFKSISRFTVNMDVTFPSTYSEAWVHFIQLVESDVATSDGICFVLYDDTGEKITEWQSLRDSGYVVQARSILDATYETISNSSSQVEYDIHYKIAATGGFVRIYVNGVLAYEKEGDTVSGTGATGCDSMRFANSHDIGTVSTTARNCFGQVLVSDEITIGSQVYTLDPSAGSINDWDAGTVTDVDESDVDDSDQASTTTNGDEFTIDTSVTLSTLTSPQKFTALVHSFRASYDSGASVTQLTPFLNDTTATSTSDGSTQALTTGLANYQYVWSNDPADSSAWTADKINDYEFGLRAAT